MSAEVERLKAAAAEIRAVRDEVQRQLDEAERQLLEERFRDVPHFSRGDKVLVRRVVFGIVRWWPAEITLVRLNYREGTWPDTYAKDPGGTFESLWVSYGAEYEQANGEKVNGGFSANEVQARP